MKKSVLFLFVTSFLSIATANQMITWVGQFPKEQALPIVELFNAKYADQAGFTVAYNSDEASITNILSGNVDPSFDLVHLKDADMLTAVTRNNLTTQLTAEVLKSWPAHLKDSQNNWVGILKRSRIIYYDSNLVSAEEVKTYESLTNPKFEGKLCLRQKKAQYTMSLNAFLLGMWGEQKTTEVLKGWSVNSAALPIIEKDLEGVISNIENGNCLVGIANTYYYMRHVKAFPNTKVKPSIPNQNDMGAHVTVDGVAVFATSTKKPQAQVFASWLLTQEPQALLSSITDKHPANPAVTSAALSKMFGSFKENTTFDLNRIADLKARALEIATEQGLK